MDKWDVDEHEHEQWHEKVRNRRICAPVVLGLPGTKGKVAINIANNEKMSFVSATVKVEASMEKWTVSLLRQEHENRFMDVYMHEAN